VASDRPRARRRARGIKTVRFTLNRALGKRAGFLRNKQLMNLKPVHAVVCEDSGLQANLLTRVREANFPFHAFGLRHQRIAAWRIGGRRAWCAASSYLLLMAEGTRA